MISSSVSLHRWSLPLVVLLLGIVQSTVALELGESCENPDGLPGKCIYTADCKPIMNLIYQGLTYNDFLFVLQSRCNRQQYQKQMVCCATDTSALLPPAPDCGFQLTKNASRSETTKINEFPWMALLKISFINIATSFRCGGALINKRYVLTAAHCITSISPGWQLRSVRLGEWDLNSNIDCENRYCNDAPIDVEIEKIIVHNDYAPQDKNRHNDIALIRLARQIEYSIFIAPICVPLSSWAYPRDYEPLYSAGWQKDDTLKKLKMELSIVSAENCTQIYERDGVSLQSSQICTSPVRLNDTWCGDSGGPLMQDHFGMWHLYGVASLDPLKCGKNGVPDVYTNVKQYVDWILENIRM